MPTIIESVARHIDSDNTSDNHEYIASLSDELLLFSLSYLSWEELVKVSECNVTLYNVSRDNSLWQPHFKRFFSDAKLKVSEPYVDAFKREYQRVIKLSRMYGRKLNAGSLVALKTSFFFVLWNVSRYGYSLEYASHALKNNVEIVLAGVRQNGLALKYASDELKNHPEIVLAAVEQKAWAIEYASDTLKNNHEIVLAAIDQDGLTLMAASQDLRNNHKIVLEAVKKKSISLKYASDELKNNAEIVLEAVKRSGWALEHASDELKNNDEIVLEAVKINGSVLRYATEAIKNNRVIVLEAVKQHAWALFYASDEQKNNHEIVLEAVKKNGRMLEYASDVLKDNAEIVLAAVKQGSRAIFYAGAAIRHHPIIQRFKHDNSLQNRHQLLQASLLEIWLEEQLFSADSIEERLFNVAKATPDRKVENKTAMMEFLKAHIQNVAEETLEEALLNSKSVFYQANVRDLGHASAAGSAIYFFQQGVDTTFHELEPGPRDTRNAASPPGKTNRRCNIL